jgi:hypothetical protein
MRKVFIVVAMFLSIGITHGQTKNKFYQYLPKDYQLEDVNGELGPAVDEDFDKDGINDLAIILFEKNDGLPIFCIYLSSNFNSSKSFKYCDWALMKHDMNYDSGILSLFSDNGSMGQFGSIKLKYDNVKRAMVIVEYEDESSNKTIKFKDWKF